MRAIIPGGESVASVGTEAFTPTNSGDTIPFGNVKERKFSEIWTDLSNPLMKRLKDKKLYVKGRCAQCKWLSICGGNFRVRAEAATGDLWGCDPACYLSDEEIAKQEA